MPTYGLRFRMRKKGLLAQEEAELEAETQKNITLKKVLQFLKIKHALLRSKACELGILDDKLRVIYEFFILFTIFTIWYENKQTCELKS